MTPREAAEAMREAAAAMCDRLVARNGKTKFDYLYTRIEIAAAIRALPLPLLAEGAVEGSASEGRDDDLWLRAGELLESAFGLLGLGDEDGIRHYLNLLREEHIALEAMFAAAPNTQEAGEGERERFEAFMRSHLGRQQPTLWAAWLAALATPRPTAEPDSAERLDAASIAQRVVQRVCDMDDRTSPEDWPEAMLVTGEELHALVIEEIDRARSAAQEVKP